MGPPKIRGGRSNKAGSKMANTVNRQGLGDKSVSMRIRGHLDWGGQIHPIYGLSVKASLSYGLGSCTAK